MMKLMVSAAALVAVAMAAPAMAVPAFYDNFEGGVSGGVWTKWTGVNDNLVITSSSHNHTAGGSKSAQAVTSDPAAWNGYADFGSYGGFVRATAWVFEDFSNNGTNPSQPVTNMLCLIGDTGGPVGFGADYLQLGVVPFFPAGSTGYGYRSLAGGIANANVARKAGWTQLMIEADAGIGAQVRFYIDGTQVGTATRSAANLRWVRIGNNSKTYENFWYDDVSVVPEPSAVLALGMGLVGLAGMRRKR